MLFNTLLLASTATATCLHGLSKFKREDAPEGEVKVGTFGYTGMKGPFHWAGLDPLNKDCNTGKQQSPINIDESVALATEKPKVDIPEQIVEFENLGTTTEVIVNGTTSFAGADFRLKQFHIHTPSEHRIGEEYFPMEAHFVHEGVTDPNNLAVIAVLFQLTTEAANPLITGLQPHLAEIATPGTKTEIEGLNFESLIEHVQTTDLFQYGGSLTTPPCAEGITFLITKEPLLIDVNSFNEIKSIVKFNSRYTQNTIGEENLLAAGQQCAAEEGKAPVVEGGAASNSTTTCTGGAPTPTAAPITKGQTITITELEGKPTSMMGVVVKN